MKSVSTTLLWPAVIDPSAAKVYGYYTQLMRSQWLQDRALQRLQALQLASRLEHAAQTSSRYAELIKPGSVKLNNARQILGRLPILTRADLQEHPESVFCNVPKLHGVVSEKRTTGSTGQPVMVKCTEVAFSLREAITLRTYAWFGMNPLRSFAAIRSGIVKGKPAGLMLPSWGGAMGRLFDTGLSYGLSLDWPIEHQRAWLEKHRPSYLLTYPSNLRVLLDELPHPWPELAAVITVGENVPDDLREDIKNRWGIPLFDQYSSEELGTIAAQCEQGSYHVAAESVLVEVLRDDGSSCQTGEIGRVVVTDLHNFATALLRYELRDFAEVGGACSCGRKLPVIKRIVGRTRNQLVLPDGTRIWPSTGLRHFDEIPIRQYQLIQLSPTELEMRLYVARTVTDDERAKIAQRILQSLGHPFEITLHVFDAPLPLGLGGKFEQFVSKIV